MTFSLKLHHQRSSFFFLESVPDAEAFYENPGTYSPHYHVLENPRDCRDVSSSASYPSGSYMDQNEEPGNHDSFDEDEDQNSFNVTYANSDDDDEPIYTDPASPVTNAVGVRDGFSSEQPDASYNQLDEEYNASSYDGAQDHAQNWDIYANSEAIRSSYNDGAMHNPGYMPDDEDEPNMNPNVPNDEPIYDNQINVDDREKSRGTPYALLREQPNEGVYENLRGKSSGVSTSDYQSLSPATERKNLQMNKPKIKPKPAKKQ